MGSRAWVPRVTRLPLGGLGPPASVLQTETVPGLSFLVNHRKWKAWLVLGGVIPPGFLMVGGCALAAPGQKPLFKVPVE